MVYSLRYIHYTLLLLSSLLSLSLSHLSSTNTSNHLFLPSTNNANPLKAIIPHCFIPGSHPDIHPTNVADCNAALHWLIREPGFTEYYRFSRNHRRGIQVPRGWHSGDCIIFTSCENDYDADTFRYADVLRVAKKVLDEVSHVLCL